MKRPRTTLGLNLEPLEDRRMMAGDVRAYAISKILYINGDAAANGIVLTNNAGKIEVAGIDQGGSPTTINHGSGSQLFTKIKDVVITMGKGDDAVAVTNLYINGQLYINAGLGNDAVALGQFEDIGVIDDAVDALVGTLSVKKQLIIDMGDGDNTVLAQDIAINSSLTISTGRGNDVVQLTAHGDPGDSDYVPGITVAKSTVISTSAGNDNVVLDRLKTKSLGVSLGAGDDSISLQDVAVTKSTTITGDAGVDTFTNLGGNTFGKPLTRKTFETIV